MAIYIPYFYIVQDIRNGMYYAGTKWAQDANPATFMVEGGYTTSSTVINEIIAEYGINIFVVRKLKTFNSGFEAYHYETRFLQKIDARNHPMFYNQHNNDHLFGYHDERYKQAMLEKYGVEHPLHSDEIKEKMKLTNLERYNAENVFSKNSNIRQSIYDTFLERYGVINISQLQETQEKIRRTSIDKRGVDHHLKDPAVIQKRIDNLKTYDEDQWAPINDMRKTTCMQKYGDPNYRNDSKIRKTNLERYGVENVSQHPDVRQKMSSSIAATKNSVEWKIARGVIARERLSQTLNSQEWKDGKGKEKSMKIREANKRREKKICQHCCKAVSPTNYTRWHGLKCKQAHSLL